MLCLLRGAFNRFDRWKFEISVKNGSEHLPKTCFNLAKHLPNLRILIPRLESSEAEVLSSHSDHVLHCCRARIRRRINSLGGISWRSPEPGDHTSQQHVISAGDPKDFLLANECKNATTQIGV